MANTIISLINPMMAAIFAAIFWGIWLRDRSRVSVLCFAVSHFFLASGFLIFHFAPNPEAIGWILFMHVIYSAGAGLICWGAARRVGQRMAISPIIAIFVISSAIIVAASFGSDMNPRLIATNTAYGLIFAMAAQLLSRSGARHPVDLIVFWLFVLAAFQFFVRPQISTILGGPMSAAEYRASEFYAIWMLWMGSIALLQAISLVAASLFDQWEAIKQKAEIDPLCGLKMRGSFESAVMQTLEANADQRLPMSIIVADIDHFKRVNDIWGHQAGDKAIAAFGQLIGSMVRPSDICGRVGGEEFCILVYDCELGPATGLADRVRRKFETMEHEDLGADIRLTASFGVAELRAGEGYGKLFARADAALYKAKDAGRDCVMADDGDVKAKAPEAGSNSLAQAIEIGSGRQRATG